MKDVSENTNLNPRKKNLSSSSSSEDGSDLEVVDVVKVGRTGQDS